MPSSVQRENGQNALFRPFTSDDSVGIKTTVDPVPLPDGSRRPLHGVIVLCDGTGNPTGILGVEEVTGYRTSMNAMVPFSWQKTVEKIVIFGTGMQALWHTRLILTLRGADVKSITYVNPGRKDDVNKINATASSENSTLWKSSCVFDGINDSHDFDISAEDRGIIEQGRLYLLHDTIENTTFRRKTPHPGTTTGPAIATQNAYNPMTGEPRGVVLVDDRAFWLRDCGELVKSQIPTADVLETGEIIALRNGRAKPEPLNAEHTRKVKANQFISEGFVFYKSVGVSLMDLTVSNAILALSKRQHHL